MIICSNNSVEKKNPGMLLKVPWNVHLTKKVTVDCQKCLVRRKTETGHVDSVSELSLSVVVFLAISW